MPWLIPDGQTQSRGNAATPDSQIWSSIALHWDVLTLMQKTILLVSRDQRVQADRTLAFSRAGYRTMRTGSLTSAVQLAAYCQMAIIGNTFSVREQSAFMRDAHETYPSLLVLCLRSGLAGPNTLPVYVADFFEARRGELRMRVVEETNLLAWPKKAS
jgi:hypothetical protein